MSDETTIAAICERTRDLALSGVPDCIEDHDGGMWLPTATRNQARMFYASEIGTEYVRVRARREYMRVNLDAIEDQARDDVESGEYEAEDLAGHIAYTWEGEGFMWSRCKKGDEGAVAFWYCEEGEPRRKAVA